MQAHIFCFFGGGFTVSFWVWNRSTWTLWKDHISKCMSSSNTDGSEDDSALLHKEKLHDNSRRGMSAYSRHNKHRHNRHSQRRHYRYATDTALGSRQHSYKSIQQEAGVADSSECFEFDSVTSCDVSSGWFSGLQKPAHATTTHLLHPTHPHQHTTQAHSSSGSVVAPTQRLSHQHPTTSNRSRRFSDSELGSMTWSHFASLESCEQQYYGHLSQLDQQSHRRLNYRHNNRYAGSHGSQQSSVGRFDYVSDRGSVSGTELDNSFMQAVPLRGKRRHYTNNDAPQMDPSALLLSSPTGGEDPPYYTHNTHYAQPALAPSAINMKDIQGMAFGQSTRRNSSISSAQSLAVPSIQMSWDLPSLDAPLNSAGGARGSAGVPLVMLRNEDLDRRSVESRIPPADESTDETLLQDKTKQISTEDNRNIPEACAAMLPHVTSNGGNSNADDAVPPSPKLAFIRVREPDSTHSLLDPGSTHSLLGISSGTVMTHPSGPSSGCVSGDDELDDLQLHDLESLSSSDDVDSSRLSDGSHRPNGSNARPALVQDKTPGPPVFQQKKIIPVTQSNRSSLATDMPYLLPGQVEDVNNAKYKRPSETVTEIDCNNVLDSS